MKLTIYGQEGVALVIIGSRSLCEICAVAAYNEEMREGFDPVANFAELEKELGSYLIWSGV